MTNQNRNEERGCCTTCDGTGRAFDESTGGLCSDCYGTGHTHLTGHSCVAAGVMTDQPEKRTATMAEVVASLAESYTDDGVAIYLASRNRLFQELRPIDVCKTAEGRYRVWCAAEAAADGVFV